MKNKKRKWIKVAMSILVFYIIASPLKINAESTYDPNANKKGYHLEIELTRPCIHNPSKTTVTVSCEGQGLQPSEDYLRSMTIFNNGLSGNIYTQYADLGGLNNIVTHLVASASVDQAWGAGYTVAAPYLCEEHAEGAYAGYAYFKHYFSRCPNDGNAYFVGSGHVWLGCSNGDVGVNEFHPTEYTHILTRYKFVPNTYAITYNGNGASGGSVPNQSATYDSWIALQQNGYTRHGYSFTGWNTRPDGTGTSYTPGQGVINLTPDNGGTVILYAQWKPWSHTVAYNANGGDGAPAPQTKTYGSVLTLNSQVPKRDGYQFAGWGENESTETANYHPGGLYGADQDGGTVTLYAIWKPQSYQVQYDGNGAGKGWMEAQSIPYGQEARLLENQYSRTGYGFTGWNTQPDGAGFPYPGAENITPVLQEFSPTGPDQTGNGLYTIATALDRRKVLDIAGGSNQDMANLQIYTYNDSGAQKFKVLHQGSGAYALISLKSDKYLDVAGAGMVPGTNVWQNAANGSMAQQWFLQDAGNGYQAIASRLNSLYLDVAGAVNADGTNIQVYTKNGNSNQKFYFEKQGSLLKIDGPTGKAVLYAQWKPNDYQIAFDGNGADSGNMASVPAVYDKSQTLPGNQFQRTGYLFDGWNTKPAGAGTSYADQAKVKNLTSQPGKTVILYAQWKPITYTIAFDGNDATEGSMENIQAVYDQETILPANGFIRETPEGPSVLVGWTREPDQAGAEFEDQETVKNLTEEDGSTVTLYAVWDDCPQIEACDRYFTLDYAREGNITEEELLGTATATDREDGTLENRTSAQTEELGKNGSLSLYGYSAADFTSLTATGAVSMTYRAVDSLGNMVKKTVMVYVTDTRPQEPTKVAYTRFINEKYYNKSYEEGGLHPDSIWRKDPEYKAALEKALSNLKNNTPEMVFRLSHEDILKAQEFIRENGFGKSQHEDALQRFYDEILEPNREK